uniref:Carboxymethylenebutenolidase n=1 Tax=OCS116 cluster bacterium TaxID=2030921 RepID=A0A2A4Z1W2_9PROT
MDTGMIEVETSDGERMPVYQAKPAEPNGGAIVVLQEIFGVNQNIRNICDGFAQMGFLAVAPELFWRQESNVQLDPSEDMEKAKSLMARLDQKLALSDVLSTATFARSQIPKNGRVGVMGYCLGGKLAYLAAATGKLNGFISYYGTGLHAVLSDDLPSHVSGLIHVAEEDYLCPLEAQQKISACFVENELVTVMSYPNMGHAFARVGGGAYEEASAQRADKATEKFLRKEISG